MRRSAAVLLLGAFMAAIAGGARAADLVDTRAWAHEDYGRIVFDWPERVDFETEVRGQVLEVRFGRPIIPSFVGVLRYLDDYVTTASVSGDGTTVTFGLTRPFGTRAFRSGNAVVVDLLDGEDSDAGPEPETAAADAARLLIRFGRHADYGRVVFDWPTSVAYTASRDGETARIRFDRGAEVDVEALRPQLPEPMQGIAARSEEGGMAIVFAVPPESEMRHFTIGNRVVVDFFDPQVAAAEDTAPAPAPAGETAEPEAESAERPAVAPPPAQPERAESTADAAEAPAPEVPEGAVRVAGVALDGGYELRFEWPIEVAAAVFERAGFLWAVFDAPSAVDLRDVEDGGGIVSEPGQVLVEPMAAVRFRLAPGFFPTVARETTTWIVTLGSAPPNVRSIPVVRETESDSGPRLALPTSQPGNELMITDPEVGDDLIVVPLSEPGRGVVPGRRFVDLEVLATAQGVAVRPISDLVTVRALRDQVEIAGLEGLSISKPPPVLPGTVAEAPVADEVADDDEETPPTPREQARTSALLAGLDDEETAGAEGGPLFDLAAWQRGGRSRFVENGVDFNRRIASSPEELRNEVLLEYAEFLFANGLAAEALGVVRLVASDDRLMAGLPRLRALRGAANVMMQRYVEAAADLDDQVFDDSAEVALWRGAVSLETGNPEQAFEQFSRSRGIVERYPPQHRLPLLLRMAESALEVGALDTANGVLDRILLSKPPERIAERANFLRAGVMAAGDRPLDARDLYEKLTTSDDRWVRARAARARTGLLLEEGMISEATAAEQLEELRFAWRGDAFELDLLKRLGELYIAQDEYYKGLSVWRDAVSYFADSPAVRETAKAMNDTFLALFIEGEADALSPVRALALYREFQELTPVGRLGDEMIFRLADRLVAVDLLEQAAELLQHQVNFRLGGPELARVGARLAAIYLLDGKPGDAVDALRTSDVVDMPDALAEERRYMMVQALSESGQTEEALALLEGDRSREADYLRADIFWDRKDWLAVATVINRIFESRNTEEPLSEIESQYMMKLVVALALSNNREALAAVRDRFAPLMADTRRNDAFRAITSYVDDYAIDPRDLTQTVADINDYEAFMASLRQRVAEENLAAIN